MVEFKRKRSRKGRKGLSTIPVEKNKEYIVEIIDNGYEGEGIAKIEGFTIFVPGALKKEKVKILIVKVNSTHAFAKILEILERHEARKESDCATYKRCGGCNLRHMRYEDTLVLKQEIVQNLVNKTLEKNIMVKETIGMEQPYEYRNKAQYPVGYKGNELVFGVYANRSHEIIPIEQCVIQKKVSVEIAKYVIAFMKENGIRAYDESTRQGLVRHIVIKVGVHSKEVMCVLVINGREFPKQRQLVEGLTGTFKEIRTVVKNINMKNTNVIMGQENEVLYGEGYICDKLGEFEFKISPLSFYQINPLQTEKLYAKAIELAKLKQKDVVLDLYCGIGTIGIFVAEHVKKVYGVEIIRQAIEDAKENARRNKIENIEFVCGDVEVVLERLVQQEGIKPDVVFVDPPRRGLDDKTIENIRKVQPRTVVYISCNPATLVRDLEQLSDSYETMQIQPLDMFPFTSHVECCSVLYLKDSIQ